MIINKSSLSLTKSLKGHRRTIAFGVIVALMVTTVMSFSGCVASYKHKVTPGTIGTIFEESYQVDVKTDDFIIKMKELNQK